MERGDGNRNAPRPGTGWLDPFARHIADNHVVIEHVVGSTRSWHT
jgi:hypothetical protein